MFRIVLLAALVALAVPPAYSQTSDAPRVRTPAEGALTPDPGRRPGPPSTAPDSDIQAQRVIVPRLRTLSMIGYCRTGALGRLVCEAAEEWRCPDTTEILVRVGEGPLETMQCEIDCHDSGRTYSGAGDCDCDFEESDCS